MSAIELRPLTLRDVPEMASVMARNREHIGRYMRSPSDVAGDLVKELCVLIASEDRGEVITVAVECDGQLSGLFSLVPLRGDLEGHEYIGWIATDTLRQGAGRAALSDLCRRAEESGIAVVQARIRSDNAPMNALAESQGFVPVKAISEVDEQGGYRWWLLRRDSTAAADR